MRITKINYSDSGADQNVEKALQAAFEPFGSLSTAYGVDTVALAAAMLGWVRAGTWTEQPELAEKVITLLWSAQTDQISTVEFGMFEITLRTPTSRTKILLRRYVGESSLVEVDFGPEGSEGRAANILDAARKVGVGFEAYAGEKKVEDAEILGLLQRQGWG